MISATRPTVDGEALYNEVASRRTNTARLNQLATIVFQRYHQYFYSEGLCTPASWPSADKALLSGNWTYLSSDGRLSDLHPHLTRLTRGYCFLCGDRKAGEVDHYLPKSSFPEFSILPMNLIPACHECNMTKRAKYTSTQPYLYFHPYLMKFPSHQFLKAEVTLLNTVIIEYRIDTSEKGPEVTALAHQFDDLKLGEIYSDQAVQFMNDQLNSYHQDYRNGGAHLMRKNRRNDANSALASRGPNHWKPVLLNALADSDEFCDGKFELLGAEVPLDL